MSLTCSCPPGTSIPDIPKSQCAHQVGQIEKILIQREYQSEGTINAFTIATEDPTLKASWAPLLTAADSTKVVSSPTLGSPEFTPGEPNIAGADSNETPNGTGRVISKNRTAFAAQMIQAYQSAVSAMKQLECDTISVYFINTAGKIYGMGNVPMEDAPTTVSGFPVDAFAVTDLNPGSYDAMSSNGIQFSLKPNWSDKLYEISPSDFNALRDL